MNTAFKLVSIYEGRRMSLMMPEERWAVWYRKGRWIEGKYGPIICFNKEAVSMDYVLDWVKMLDTLPWELWTVKMEGVTEVKWLTALHYRGINHTAKRMCVMWNDATFQDVFRTGPETYNGWPNHLFGRAPVGTIGARRVKLLEKIAEYEKDPLEKYR